MFERYSSSSRRAIFFARWWALNRAVPQIEVSDLILGIAHESHKPESPHHWINLNRDRLAGIFAAGVTCVEKPEVKELPLTDTSKRALAYAAMETEADRRYCLEPYHLLRGVLRTDDPAAKQMVKAGYTLESLRAGSQHANRNVIDPKRRHKLRTSTQILRWRVARIPWYAKFGVACATVAAAILYLRSQN